MDRCHHTNIQIKAIEEKFGLEAATAASASAQLIDASIHLANACSESREQAQENGNGLIGATYHLAAKHGLDEPSFQLLANAVIADYKAAQDALRKAAQDEESKVH